MHRRLATCLALLLCALALAPLTASLAQEASPMASPAAGLDVDLAAMTLDSTAMPAGYAFSGESFVDHDVLAENFVATGIIASAEELAALNVTGDYESYYGNADFTRTIRTYVIAYETEADVRAGFDLFEDESRTVPEEFGTWVDEPGLAGVGEAPAEVTTVTFEFPDRAPATTVDVTFRVGRVQAGVSLEIVDLGGGAGAGSPDRDLLEGLAGALEARVTAVLAGGPVPGVDPALPEVVPTLGGSFFQEGYLTAADALLDRASTLDPDAFRSAYQRVGFFESDQPELSPPSVLTVGVARFEDAEAARDVLDRADEILPAEGDHARADVDEVGGDPAAGHTYASFFSPGQADSFRIIVAADDLLVWVMVEGIVPVGGAEALALGFAEDAVACATGGTSCGPYALPAEQAGPAASPAASPVA